MDSADEAQMMEEYGRLEALHRHKASHDSEALAGRKPGNGPVLCLECEAPIPAARLSANPQAVRCIDCQQEYEREQKLYVLDG